MSDNPLKERLIAARETAFNSEDRHLYLHVGFFTVWFSAVELRIAMLLAMVTGSKDLETFDLLTRGMDAKTKLERLRYALTIKRPLGTARSLGVNLAKRFVFFERKIVPIRNKLAHSWLTTDDDYDSIHFASLSKLPWLAYGEQQYGEPPENMPLLNLFDYGLWLHRFSTDLLSVIDDGFPSGILEIENPLTPPPPEAHQRNPSKPQRATAGRRERKRARKGQPPRGTKPTQ